MPASLASSTTYWIRGISTMVSISFGIALVAGRKRVPRPATGKTALRMAFMEPARMEPWRVYTGCVNNRETLSGALSRANDERGIPVNADRPPPHLDRAAARRRPGARAGRPLSHIAPGRHRIGCAAVRQVERGARRIRPSADDARRHPCGGRGLQELP